MNICGKIATFAKPQNVIGDLPTMNFPPEMDNLSLL
jgi:hypothetical protein